MALPLLASFVLITVLGVDWWAFLQAIVGKFQIRALEYLCFAIFLIPHGIFHHLARISRCADIWR